MTISLGLSEDRAGLHDACTVGRAAFCLAWISSNIRVPAREFAVRAGRLGEHRPAHVRLNRGGETPVVAPAQGLVEHAGFEPYALGVDGGSVRELAYLKDALLPAGFDLAHSLSDRVVPPRADGGRACLDHSDLPRLGLGVEHV